jgi:hypothetical protein
MQRYYDTVTDQRGSALAGASVAVQSGGSNVSIYSDDGVTLKSNPMTTDASGGFSFYAANGTYDLVVTSASGVVSSLPSRVRLFDVADAGLASSAALAASSGAALVGFDGGTLQDVLDDAKPMQSYTALRAYTGRATGVRITTPGVAGFFARSTTDTTSADNGGTIIVDGSGRRWLRLYSGAVNVKWFGAVGDGVTDDTAAIQAGLTYLNARDGGVLWFPKGAYLVSDRCFVYSSTTVLGESGAVLKPTAAASMLAVLQVSAGSSNVAVRGLSFDMNETSMIAVLAGSTGCSKLLVKGCRFYNSTIANSSAYIVTHNGIDGVAITGNDFESSTGFAFRCYNAATNISVSDNRISGCYGGIRVNNFTAGCSDVSVVGNRISTFYNRGIVFEQADRVVAIGNVITDTTSTGTAEEGNPPFGISVQLGCTNVLIANNIVDHGGEISLYDSWNVVAVGNRVNLSNAAGIEFNDNIQADAPQDAYNGVISNNVVTNSVGSGIYTSGSDVLISNNICDSNGASGIKVAEGALRVNGYHNLCRNNGQLVVASGITLNNSTDTASMVDCVWESNVCIDSQAVKTQEYGIRIAGPISNLTLRNNVCSPVATTPIESGGITSGAETLYLFDNFTGSASLTRNTNYETTVAGGGLVVTTPDGTKRYLLSVNDSGTVTATLQ